MSIFLSYLLWAPLQIIATFFVGLEVTGLLFSARFRLILLVIVPL